MRCADAPQEILPAEVLGASVGAVVLTKDLAEVQGAVSDTFLDPELANRQKTDPAYACSVADADGRGAICMEGQAPSDPQVEGHRLDPKTFARARNHSSKLCLS